jgi:hypothetical protein
MRRIRLVGASLMGAVLLLATGCTPEAAEGVGQTIGQLILWWLWGMLPPHP